MERLAHRARRARVPRRRTARTVAVAVTLTLGAAACGYHSDPRVVHLSDPGNCVPVDVAADTTTAALLDDAAARFNGSRDARLPGGRCAFVRVEEVDAPVVVQRLLAGWPAPDHNGPAPVAWVPGSTMWAELLDARLAARHARAIAPSGTPIARTPLVVAMPGPMAHALGYPRRPVGWADLVRLARDPRGWGALGHPEWGAFRLGRGNPNWSTTGLDASVALDATAPDVVPALERAVAYYGDTTRAYFENWLRLSRISPTASLRYMSAAVADERSVVAFDSGHDQTDVALTGSGTRPPVHLVAVYLSDATIEADNPLVVLDVPWSTDAARAGARRFAEFMLAARQQAAVAAAGFRPARGPARTDVLRASNGVDPTVHGRAVAPASPATILRALARWESARRPARVLVLFDVSASMADPAEDRNRPGATVPMPSKLTRLQAALAPALGQLAPRDEIALREFSTNLGGRPTAKWRELVPSGSLATRRTALERAIGSLAPAQGSPLYSATRDAYDALTRHADAQHLDAVVLVTDGYNEDDRDTDRAALLRHLGANPNVRVFPLVYSNDADIDTLKQIAAATNAWYYDARDTREATEQLARLFASL